MERDRWSNNVQTKSKLRLYHLLKKEYNVEPYTSTVNILSHCSLFATLRGRLHNMQLKQVATSVFLQKNKYVKIIIKKWKMKYVSLLHAYVLKWKENFFMSTLKRVTLITFSVIKTSTFISFIILLSYFHYP